MIHHYGLDIPLNLEKALYYYDEGLKIDPHDSNICLQKAQLYLYNMKKYDQVLAVVNQAKNPTTLYTIIGTCYSRGYGCDIDISKGNNYLKKAISNKDYRAYHQLILNAISIKDDEHMLEYLKEYSKHFKDYNNLYGKIYLYGIGVEVNNDKSVDYFVKCLKENPNDTNALYFLAKIYFEAQEYEVAYEYMEECYNKGSVNCNYFLYELYRQGICVEKSDKKCKELLQKGADKDDSQCLVGLADICFENSLYDKGYEYLQKATIAETEDNFAIISYIYYVKNKMGIKSLLEMRKHFEFIHKIYEKRKRWFHEDYCELKDLYVKYIIQGTQLKKTKDEYNIEKNERAKALYIYSGTSTHAFLLIEYLIVKEVDKSLVNLVNNKLGAYYTVNFDAYKDVKSVEPRIKLDDLLEK